MTPPDDGSLPECPLCGMAVVSVLGEGSAPVEAYNLFPCRHRVSAPETVEEYTQAVLRSLGYQR